MLEKGPHTERTLAQWNPDLVENAGERILSLFNERADARLVFHNYSFTVDLLEHTLEIAKAEKADKEERLLVQLAAWFFHAGRLFDYEHPERESLRLAGEFLQEEGVDSEHRALVLDCLEQALGKERASLHLARWLQDAVTINTFIAKAESRRPLLHLEWELMMRRRLDKVEWAQYWLQQLFSLKLYTHMARLRYEAPLAQQLRELKKVIEKGGGAVDDPQRLKSRRFHTLEKNRPTRAVQTFFRTNYRNHINLSSIADNKANIMISVNSILISVLITILTYQNITQNRPIILLPVVIFLVTGLASLIFAVLSARPKVTQLNEQQDDPEKIKRNIVFFGNFVHLDLEDYENAMDKVFRDNELLYGNMTRDLYFLGKVLDKKYRYLSISYNIFMLGFVATVTSFLLAILF